jgi:uncharacterized lipoprotein YajG
MKHLIHGFVAVSVLALTAGCATTRTNMSLEIPSPGSAVVSGGKPVVIDAIHDMRVFEIDPEDPSTPSLKKGASYALDAVQRKQAIARKRGGFGKAFGDILLTPGEDVESLTRQLLTNAFASRGYSVLDAANAPAGTPHVSVDIRQFWAWFTPGFWSASIEAKLDTLLKIDSPQGHRQVAVKGYGRNSIQVAREANRQLAYQRAFEHYLKQFAEAANNNGL